METPLELPCGVMLRNRFFKAAMSENLADPFGRPDIRLQRLYSAWGESSAAVLLTGNVQVDDLHLEAAGNMRIEQFYSDPDMQEMYKSLALKAQRNGCQCWVQLSHAGRNTDPKVSLS